MLSHAIPGPGRAMPCRAFPCHAMPGQCHERVQVREVIGAFAAPDVIHWAPGLPKTRSGKIMRRYAAHWRTHGMRACCAATLSGLAVGVRVWDYVGCCVEEASAGFVPASRFCGAASSGRLRTTRRTSSATSPPSQASRPSPAQPTNLNPALQSHSHMPRRYDGCPRTGYCLSPLRMSPPRLPWSEGAR